MEHLPDYEDCPNQHENRHELYDKTGHHLSSLKEFQWKLTKHDQSFPKDGKLLENKN